MSVLSWLRGDRPYRDPEKVILTREEMAQADRLSRLTGKTRDEVFREAYRKSDAMMADYDLAESHRLGEKSESA